MATLRRAGLSEEQKTLVMSQCGTDLAFDKVASVMQTTFGEKQMPSDKKHRPAAAVHYTDAWDDECWDHEEQHDDWSTADAYYGAEEEEDDWYDAYDDDVYYGDDGEDWYDPEGWTEQAHDVDEYDDVYSNYVEARKRMNDLRLSRGFYPIVALCPTGPTRADYPSGRGKGKGKNKKGSKGKSSKGKPAPRIRPKGKGKGKTKGKPTMRPRPTAAPNMGPSSAPADTSSVCLRCGKTGHWARDCPMPPRKRPHTSPADEEMMVTDARTEQLSEVFLQADSSPAKEAVLDGGAQSFVVGQNVLAKYADYLRANGIEWQPKHYPCSKMFRFGNDETMVCTTSTVIPVNFAGKTGHLHVYVLPGNTPFLFPRPLMEKFGLVVDFGRKRLQWDEHRWTQVRQRSSGGHYLLDLAEDPTSLRRELRKPSFVYAPDDLQRNGNLLEVGDATGHMDDEEPEYTDHTKNLPTNKVRSICYAAESAATKVTKQLKHATKPLVRKRKCWEVYVGLGLVSYYLRLNCVEVKQFVCKGGEPHSPVREGGPPGLKSGSRFGSLLDLLVRSSPVTRRVGNRGAEIFFLCLE